MGNEFWLILAIRKEKTGLTRRPFGLTVTCKQLRNATYASELAFRAFGPGPRFTDSVPDFGRGATPSCRQVPCLRRCRGKADLELPNGNTVECAL